MKPELKEIVSKVRGLQKLTETTGFKTSRSVGELLGHLSAEDLAEVAQELERIQKPIGSR